MATRREKGEQENMLGSELELTRNRSFEKATNPRPRDSMLQKTEVLLSEQQRRPPVPVARPASRTRNLQEIYSL